jgi:small subunit ribosomal protein S16
MLKIRLQRTGRINDPSFRIVVVEHTESTKSGSFVERLGTYNPKTKVKNLAADRIKYWLSVGAQASGTVHNMLISAGITSGKKVNVLPRKSPPKKEGDAGDGGATAAAAAAIAAAASDEADSAGTDASGDAGAAGGNGASA